MVRRMAWGMDRRHRPITGGDPLTIENRLVAGPELPDPNIGPPGDKRRHAVDVVGVAVRD